MDVRYSDKLGLFYVMHDGKLITGNTAEELLKQIPKPQSYRSASKAYRFNSEYRHLHLMQAIVNFGCFLVMMEVILMLLCIYFGNGPWFTILLCAIATSVLTLTFNILNRDKYEL